MSPVDRETLIHGPMITYISYTGWYALVLEPLGRSSVLHLCGSFHQLWSTRHYHFHPYQRIDTVCDDMVWSMGEYGATAVCATCFGRVVYHQGGTIACA